MDYLISNKQTILATATCMAVGGICFILFQLAQRPDFGQKIPKYIDIRQYPILGAVEFFTRKTDFFRELRNQSHTGNFSFYVGKKLVIGVTASSSRATFYETRELAFGEAAAEFYSGIPQIKDMESKNSVFGILIRNLTKLLRPDNLAKNLDSVTADVRKTCREFALNEPTQSGWCIVNPHEHMHRLVFQMTMRTVGIKDFADSPDLMNQSLRLIEQFEQSETVSRIIFPWLPTWNHMRRMWTGLRFYLLVSKVINKRKATGIKVQDPLQMLIDQGDDTKQIVSYLMAALFAGLVNTGLQVSWILIYLGVDSEWQERVRAEGDAVVAQHRTSPDQSPHEVLASITLHDWETKFPLIELCLRETIRMQVPGISLRKNLGDDDVPLQNHGETIPKGAFAAFLFDTVHQDPDIYANPGLWDPKRYLPERAEDKKLPHSFLGWGSGMHPCTGQRFAKLEVTMIVAFFSSQFDYGLADERGNMIEREIEPVGLDTHISKKPEEPFFIRYKPRAN